MIILDQVRKMHVHSSMVSFQTKPSTHWRNRVFIWGPKGGQTLSGGHIYCAQSKVKWGGGGAMGGMALRGPYSYATASTTVCMSTIKFVTEIRVYLMHVMVQVYLCKLHQICISAIYVLIYFFNTTVWAFVCLFMCLFLFLCCWDFVCFRFCLGFKPNPNLKFNPNPKRLRLEESR